MYKSINYLKSVLFICSSILVHQCSPSFNELLSKGSVSPTKFNQLINTNYNLGLVFVPVTIQGIDYNFLLDTGAPLSISKELQSKLQFKKISQRSLTDSDGNKVNVDYVKIDTLMLANVHFLNQSAFVGDFKANPLLACLNIDGIVGSNLMRYCNWTIDPKEKHIRLFKDTLESIDTTQTLWPFKTDHQYDIIVDVEIGRATAHKVKVDYGSNGYLSLPKKGFNVLKEYNIIDSLYLNVGRKQSGLAGKAVDYSIENAISDSIKIKDLKIPQSIIRGSMKGLLGTQILNQYVTTIRWDKKMLLLKPTNEPNDIIKKRGFTLGVNSSGDVIIQNLIKNSEAWEKGLRSNMKVLKLNEFDFENKHTYCDFVNQREKLKDTVHLTYKDLEMQVKELVLTQKTVNEYLEKAD